MINTDMRDYQYYLYDTENAYGQETLIKDENGENVPQGTIRIAINITSQSIQDNIKYHNATYIGLTHSEVTDKMVIQYGEDLLKVLYVNPRGRYKQVFLGDI